MKIIDTRIFNDAAEQIVKELASRNIRIVDLDEVFERVKEKVNKAFIVNNDEQKPKEVSIQYHGNELELDRASGLFKPKTEHS